MTPNKEKLFITCLKLTTVRILGNNYQRRIPNFVRQLTLSVLQNS